MCGIAGIVAREPVAPLLYLAGWSLQHRGQESAGMATFDGENHFAKRDMGTVEAVFGGNALEELKGEAGIAHTRYSTMGSSSLENVQPVKGEFRGDPFWIAHNGNLTKFEGLALEAKTAGYQFTSGTDTEIIAALIHFSKERTFEGALKATLQRITGTYALAILYKNTVFGVRDPTGNRPLIIGQGKDMMLVASETATCDVLGVQFLREVEPGETIVLDHSAKNWYRVDHRPHQRLPCLFEFVYFQRPDSKLEGRRAQSVRVKTGRCLWQDHPAKADIVVPVPDSGTSVALGVAEESKLPFVMTFFRSHFVGRTFLKPLQAERTKGLNIKLNAIPELVLGRRIVLVDDSIVRANVMKGVIAKLRCAGAREIHVRIGSPPYMWPCHYGIDTSRIEGELVAARNGGNVESIRREIGADSLEYLGLKRLKQAIAGRSGLKFCDACFSGNYHIPIK